MKKPERALDRELANRAASCRFSTIDMIVLGDGTFMPVYGCGRYSGGDSSKAIVCRLQCRAVMSLIQCMMLP